MSYRILKWNTRQKAAKRAEQLARVKRANRAVAAGQVVGGAVLVAAPADSFWVAGSARILSTGRYPWAALNARGNNTLFSRCTWTCIVASSSESP